MGASNREEGLWIQTGNPFTTSEASPVFAPGQVGKVSPFRNANAENGVATTPAPIDIQYVKRYATDTLTVAAGSPAFWQDTDNFVVTAHFANAVGATTAPLLAGVFGGSSLAAGSFGYIQVGGVGPARLLDSTSSVTVGVPLVWSTNQVFRQAGTQESNLQVLGVGRSLTTVTGTNVSVEALINVARLAW
jgi:hypothetical protein